MKHRLHPIPFESAIAHIKHNRASRVFVRVNNNYIRLALSCDQSLIEWVDCEFYYEEEYDLKRVSK